MLQKSEAAGARGLSRPLRLLSQENPGSERDRRWREQLGKNIVTVDEGTTLQGCLAGVPVSNLTEDRGLKGSFR